MDREIKFRAWEDYQYTYSDESDVYLKQIDGEMWMIRDTERHCSHRELPFGEKIGKAQQFTGLKDNKGIDIYEGDVVYLAGCGNYVCEYPFLELYDAKAENDIGEIKGNIFENPELLEGV